MSCYNVITKKYIRRCCLLLQIDSLKNLTTTGSLSSLIIKLHNNGLNLLYKNYLSCLNKLEKIILLKMNNRLTDESKEDKEDKDIINHQD